MWSGASRKGSRDGVGQGAQGGGFRDLGVLTLMSRGDPPAEPRRAEIWTRINGIHTLDKISEEIAALFGWEEEETEEAVLDFLKGLGRRGG